MRKFLKRILVIQEVKNTKANSKGRGFSTAYRLNPFNPISYITVVFVFVAGILMFGFVGFWKENRNPFKWD